MLTSFNLRLVETTFPIKLVALEKLDKGVARSCLGIVLCRLGQSFGNTLVLIGTNDGRSKTDNNLLSGVGSSDQARTHGRGREPSDFHHQVFEGGIRITGLDDRLSKPGKCRSGLGAGGNGDGYFLIIHIIIDVEHDERRQQAGNGFLAHFRCLSEGVGS